jgi:hypothetical protein
MVEGSKQSGQLSLRSGEFIWATANYILDKYPVVERKMSQLNADIDWYAGCSVR